MALRNIKLQINRIFLISLSFNLFLLASCTKTKEQLVNKEPIYETIFPIEFLGIATGKKIYLTSFGQSKEIEDLNLFLFSLLSVEYLQDNQLEISNVEEGSIVLAVVGCSIKGLEVQNTNIKKEIARCKTFVDAQKNGKITLVTWHLGGMARRGSTSDEIIGIALAGSALAIFVASGNEDAYLTTILKNYQVPFFIVASITKINIPIQYLFNGEVSK